MTTPFLFVPVFQGFDNAGGVLAGGLLYTYSAGTNTNKATYSDALGAVANTNPVVLDSTGRATVRLGSGSYHLVLTDSTGATTIWDEDYYTAPYLTAADIGSLLYPQTAAEVTAGVTPSSYAYTAIPIDIRRYGGVGDGSTDNAVPLAVAASVAGVSGDEVFLPQGTYNFSSFPSLDNKQNVVFKGVAQPNSGASRGSRLMFTGTGTGVVVSMLSSQGCQFKNLQFGHTSSSFTGTYFKVGNTSGDAYMNAFTDMFIGANVGAGVTHFDLNKSTNTTFSRITFFAGAPAVKGQLAAGGGYANVVRFHDCEFVTSLTTPVFYGGQSWSFDGCTFEPLSTGVAGAFDSGSTTTPTKSLSFRGCWFGDVSSGTGTWISFSGFGLEINGNAFGGNAGSNAISIFTAKGVDISANYFDTFAAMLAFSDGSCGAVTFTGNSYGTITNPFATTANIPIDTIVNPNSPIIAVPTNIGTTIATTPGWERSPNGIITQWGFSAVTVGTPVAVTLPKAYPGGLLSVVTGLGAPTLGTNTAYVTSVSASSITLNLSGSAGNTGNIYWMTKGY